ncbi:MAG: hypothetical protein LC101_00470 [Flavobacteriales bacterium]|nr:hypothetical protein [Flavobacteriales bacterium]
METVKMCFKCFTTDDIHNITVSSGKKYTMCSSCINYNIFICEECNTKELTYRKIYIDDNGEIRIDSIICKVCFDNNENLVGGCINHIYDSNLYTKCPCQYPTNFKWGISSHNEDVLNHYNPDYHTKELFGIEIEVGTERTNRLFIEEILAHTKKLTRGNAILKWDSSIDYLDGSEKQEPNDYCGFEIVTRPMAYKSAKGFIEKLADNRHRLLRCWEVGTTGIHIHVNKKYLRPIEIGKILLFMNAATNRDFIVALAKRNEKKYAKFLKRSILNFGDSSPSCHYHAVNTSKPNTIEFRVFRGTLNKNTMVSYLQFVKSLIEFIKVAPIGGTPPYVSTKKNQLTYKQYVDWLFTTNRSQYRELKSRICNEDMKTIVDRGEI